MDAAPDLLRLPDSEPVSIDEGAVAILQRLGDGAEIVEGTWLGSQRRVSPPVRVPQLALEELDTLRGKLLGSAAVRVSREYAHRVR